MLPLNSLNFTSPVTYFWVTSTNAWIASRRGGEEAAAIAMALHEFMNDAHDVEDMILTINKVKRTYSPWSSKIYTLRQTPKR